MLGGKTAEYTLVPSRGSNGVIDVQVEMRLFDPMRKVQGAAFHYMLTESYKDPQQARTQGIASLPGGQKLDLNLELSKGAGRFTLNQPGRVEYQLTCQAVLTTADGKTTFTEPRPLRVAVGSTTVVGKPPEKPPARPPVEQAPLTEEELARVLDDLKSGEKVRILAATGRLTRAEPKARRDEVARALETALENPDGLVRRFVVQALAVWAIKDNGPALMKLASDPDFGLRWTVLNALATAADPRAAEVVAPRLIDHGDRSHASKALQAMGPAAEKTVLPFLKHNDWAVRLEACRILKTIGTKESVAPLQELAKTRDNLLVTRAADEALQTIGQRQ